MVEAALRRPDGSARAHLRALAVRAGRADPAGALDRVSFTIRTPSGKPLTEYKECCEPHEGVDLIIVRSDDSHIQYLDADADSDGRVSEPVVFPTPGRYRITIDAYPKVDRARPRPFNFQLFKWVTVRGKYRPTAASSIPLDAGGRRLPLQIQGHPHLKAIEPSFLVIHVTDAAGRKAVFTNWRGALAHAIFFHQGSLAYSHTHVCKPGAIYCFSALGNMRVTGHSTAPGILKVGVLLPSPGPGACSCSRTWEATSSLSPSPSTRSERQATGSARPVLGARVLSAAASPRRVVAIDVLRTVLGG